MNLQDLRYVLALAEHGHVGRAAEAIGVSQPTLSVQLRRLEERLGVTLFERGAKGVTATAVGAALLPRMRAAVAEVDAMMQAARDLRDPLAGRFRLGIIPTLAPYLLPLIFAPLRAALPALDVEPWEEETAALEERLRAHELDAILVATELHGAEFASCALFAEPFFAALPPGHALAALDVVDEEALAPDVLVLADGHCLRDQTLAACGRAGLLGGPLRAASLSTLLNMVAAGYGTTLIPGLAAGAAEDAGIVLRPLRAGSRRTVRLGWRSSYPRAGVVEAVAAVIGDRLAGHAGRPAEQGSHTSL